MNLFLYMPIISPKMEFIHFFDFFSLLGLKDYSLACIHSMKMLEACGKLTPSSCWHSVISLLWKQRAEYMAACFHVVAVAWVRCGLLLWHRRWQQGCAPKVGRTFSSFLFRVGSSSAFGFIVTGTWGGDESEPNGKKRFLSRSSSAFFRAHDSVFLEITRVGYNKII